MGAKMGEFVFSSVIAPEDPKDGKLVAGALPQIDRCFENMKLMMKAAGGSDSGINHAWVFMKDFDYQPAMVERWVKDYPTFGDRPARKTLALRSCRRHADPGPDHGLISAARG